MLAQKAMLTANTNRKSVLAKAATHVGNRERLYLLINKNNVKEEDRTPTFSGVVADLHEPSNMVAVEDEEINLPSIDAPADDTGQDTIVLHDILKQQRDIDNDETQDVRSVYAKILDRTNQQLDNAVEDEEIDDQTSGWVSFDSKTDSEPLDTSKIEEEARKQVERELQNKLQQHRDAFQKDDEKTARDTSDLSYLIKEEVRDFIKKDVDKDLEDLRVDGSFTQNNDDIEVDKYINESLEPDDTLLKSLKSKVDAYKKRKKGESNRPTKPKVNSEDADQIKQFMKNQAKDKRQKSGEIDDNITRSLSDTSPIVSETMAKVYTRQGHYQKAIDIYQQLSLKYPQKKLYFADKIIELKKKL